MVGFVIHPSTGLYLCETQSKHTQEFQIDTYIPCAPRSTSTYLMDAVVAEVCGIHRHVVRVAWHVSLFKIIFTEECGISFFFFFLLLHHYI